MALYNYEAVHRDGKRVQGRIEAQNRVKACEKLEQEKLQPISLKEEGGGLDHPGEQTLPATSRTINLNRAQIIIFTEEISDLLDAGLQLEPALRIMEQRQDKSAIKSLVADLRQQIREGRNFADSLRISSRSFGELYCNLVAAGEASGALPQILRRQLNYLVILQEIQDRVKTALIYPSIVFSAGIVMLFLFLTCLVPQMTMLFAKTGKELPLATRLLIDTSDFVASYWIILFALTALTAFAFYQFIRRPAGRNWWDRQKLKVPLVGEILKVSIYAQFSQTMSTMLKNGIPLLQALRLVSAAETNVHYRSLFQQAANLVGEGAALSRSLGRSGQFPPTMLDIITVGEQTGNIGQALEKAAVRYDKELKRRIHNLTTMIEPAIIILMALMVGVVAYSMITGIFQSVSGLRARL